MYFRVVFWKPIVTIYARTDREPKKDFDKGLTARKYTDIKKNDRVYNISIRLRNIGC